MHLLLLLGCSLFRVVSYGEEIVVIGGSFLEQEMVNAKVPSEIRDIFDPTRRFCYRVLS